MIRTLDRSMHAPGRGCKTGCRKTAETIRRTAGVRPTASAKPPEPIAGAIWQAGVTANSDRFKVLLDGEPRADIIAAGDDWVMLLAPLVETDTPIGPNAPLGRDYLTDPFAAPRRLSTYSDQGRARNVVTFVRADGSPLSRLDRHLLGIP